MKQKKLLFSLLGISALIFAGCTTPLSPDNSQPNNNSGDVEYTADSWKTMIPNSCVSFNDGCNQCVRSGSGDDAACTRMYCENYQKPYCTDDQTNQEKTTKEDYIGLSVEEAKDLAEQDGVAFRVINLNGESLPMTLDYQLGRINATVSGGIVTMVSIEGKEEESGYIGLSLEEAITKAEQDNVPFRIVELDGEPQAVTMDLRPGRINASVSSGIVTNVTIEQGGQLAQ